MDFSAFKQAVATQYERMQAHPMFRASIAGQDLWESYLAAFPEGTNPIYRKRTEYDCGCCRQFIKAIGNAVAVIDSQLVSVWDLTISEPAYQKVADALAALVKSKPITDAFLYYERTAGTDKNFEQIVEPVSEVKTWKHFFVNVKPAFVKKRADIPSALSVTRSSHDVLLRALKEIDLDSIDTVLDLIAQGSLYRGEEHRHAVDKLRALKMQFDALTDDMKDRYVWTLVAELPASIVHVRSSVIGTLLTDLAEGKPLENAVASFEAKVAPTNYKRPTALITKAMIERAKAQIQELGLTSALERRFAIIDDISINNVLFADRKPKPVTTSVLDELTASAGAKPKNFDKIEEVPIDKFLADIVPRVDSIEVLLENKHAGNLVSLIAAADPTAQRLFKWPNPFSWSYQGELADSIKERVKKAGGNVEGDVCCRLAWFNYDDLDFHMQEPGGYEIYFANRTSTSPSGGRLDVDMNAGGGTTREPVENIFYQTLRQMKHGVYTLYVHQYYKRESVDIGFEVEVDIQGHVQRIAYANAVASGAKIGVARFMRDDNGIRIIESLPATESVRTLWGLPTQTFHRVRAALLSPNHWDGHALGNKHYFFMLEGCANDGTARGFFNEFLTPELDTHRKVLEVVGSKMKAAAPVGQLSGLGFSSTQRNTLVCQVRGSFTRIVKVVF
jgi:hypothetical protein